MRLETDRVLLKPLSFDELEGNYPDWFNDPEVCRYNSHGETNYTKEMAAEFIKSLENDPQCMVWAVYLKENNLHIGNVSLQKIDRKNQSAEIAYIFGEKEYWGKGFAAEASRLILKIAFDILNLHRVYFGTHIENTAMQNLGKALGFREEGILKEAQYKNGKFNDVVMYSLLEEDYEVLQKMFATGHTTRRVF